MTDKELKNGFRIFGLIVLCLVLLVVRGCWRNGYRLVGNQTRTSTVVSLETSSEVSCFFVLGIGSVDGDDYYVFYRKTESGGFIREKIPTDNCIVYETDSEPCIVEAGNSIIFLDGGQVTSNEFDRDDYSYTQKLYVPKGTIHKKFEL